MAPRGTTPLLEDAAVQKITGALPPGYTVREYSALIARGATPAMVETFGLSFTDDEGIGEFHCNASQEAGLHIY